MIDGTVSATVEEGTETALENATGVAEVTTGTGTGTEAETEETEIARGVETEIVTETTGAESDRQGAARLSAVMSERDLYHPNVLRLSLQNVIAHQRNARLHQKPPPSVPPRAIAPSVTLPLRQRPWTRHGTPLLFLTLRVINRVCICPGFVSGMINSIGVFAACCAGEWCVESYCHVEHSGVGASV